MTLQSLMNSGAEPKELPHSKSLWNSVSQQITTVQVALVAAPLFVETIARNFVSTKPTILAAELGLAATLIFGIRSYVKVRYGIINADPTLSLWNGAKKEINSINNSTNVGSMMTGLCLACAHLTHATRHDALYIAPLVIGTLGLKIAYMARQRLATKLSVYPAPKQRL